MRWLKRVHPMPIRDVQDTVWLNLRWVKTLDPVESAWARFAIDAICVDEITRGAAPGNSDYQ